MMTIKHKRIKTKLLVLLCLLTVMAVLMIASCSQESRTSSEELVVVSFDQNMRALVSALEDFDKDTLYWFYAARKTPGEGGTMLDGSGLKSGETPSYDWAGAMKVKEGTGLGTVSGFSQGLWDFLLFGCKREGTEGSYSYHIAYQGEITAVSLKKGGTNAVNVVVSPVSTTEKGTLFVDTDNIIFDPVQEETTGIAEFAKVVTVTRVSDDQPQESETTTYILDPGVYRVAVAFTYVIEEETYTYAEGYVLSTIYSNLTTTVTGDLSELVTFATFEAEEATE